MTPPRRAEPTADTLKTRPGIGDVVLRNAAIRRLAVRLARGACAFALLTRPVDVPRRGSDRPTRHSCSTHGGSSLDVVVRKIARREESGPTWSVFAGQYELFRADLFEDNPHVHLNYGTARATGTANQQWRVHAGRNRESLIAWSAAELRCNLRTHIAVHPLPSVRRFDPSAGEIDDAVEWLTTELRRRYGERSGTTER